MLIWNSSEWCSTSAVTVALVFPPWSKGFNGIQASFFPFNFHTAQHRLRFTNPVITASPICLILLQFVWMGDPQETVTEMHYCCFCRFTELVDIRNDCWFPRLEGKLFTLQTVDIITQTPSKCSSSQCNIHTTNGIFVKILVFCWWSKGFSVPAPICSPGGQVGPDI